MGDAVNLCQRMEASNKDYGSTIMLNETAWQAAKDKIICRELDLIRLKGKKIPIKVFELLGMNDGSKPLVSEKCMAYFFQGREAYKKQDFATAIEKFKSALEEEPHDGPSKTYLERCEEFLQNPPGDDWDGVYETKTK
jgi:adenylate cyclase